MKASDSRQVRFAVALFPFLFLFLFLASPAPAVAQETRFDPAPMAEAVARLEKSLGGRIGVAVIDTASGARWGHREDERFPLNSTFKTFLCAQLLAAASEGRKDMKARVAIRAGDIVRYSPVTEKHVAGSMTLPELCKAAISLSDNTAANLVLDSLGGPKALTGYLRGIGDEVTRLDRRETVLNEGRPGDPRDTTTPLAAASTLKTLVLGDVLAHGDREKLTGWLEGNLVGKDTLRAGLPASWRIGDKTGAGGYGSRGNIAVIWPDGRAPVVIAVYLTETEAAFAARNAAIAEIGRALAQALEVN